MLDRVWWIWQMQDPEKRTPLIPNPGEDPMTGMPGMGGHRRSASEQEKRADTDNIIDLGWIAPRIPLVSATDALGGNEGQFCYYYI